MDDGIIVTAAEIGDTGTRTSARADSAAVGRQAANGGLFVDGGQVGEGQRPQKLFVAYAQLLCIDNDRYRGRNALIATAGVDDHRLLTAVHAGIGTGCGVCLGTDSYIIALHIQQHTADVGTVVAAQTLLGNGSDNSSPDYRGYFENCDLAGVVDWICGNGDIWFEKCNLILRDRTGNNIAAPSTEDTQAWGYVFNNCIIRPETDQPTQLKGNDWTLARPWDKSPACTFLNTKMYTQPRSYGWNRMTAGKVVRFHECNSVDGSDTQIPLGTRSLAACSPAPGSDDCILTAAEATGYNIRNVMGGNDAFEPQELCKQIDALSGLQSKKDDEEEDKEKVDTENHIIWTDNLVLDDDKLQWNDQKEALCYFLFKLDENGKWKYQTNVTDCFVNLTQYGSGDYCVRAANQRGGLGAATQAIHYTLVDTYELVIKKVEGYKEDGVDYGWSTICLPFNAKVPEGVKAYAATAHNSNNETDIIRDFTMTLTEVNIINANKGYVVYGPVGSNYFHPTSRESNEATILKGNPTSEYISSDNNNGYVLSYKSTWGLGFYKYTGSQLSPYRAWLPQNMVSKSNSENLALGKQAIHLVFAKGTSGILSPVIQADNKEEKLFNLSGLQVEKTTKGLVISRKKGKFIKK